jgi:hypothetical protein
MAHYKHGGDVHKAVKEKSMHHLGHGEAKHRKTGGRADEGDDLAEPDAEETYAGKGSNVEKEAHGEVRKKGGKVCKKAGGKAEERKRGGKAEKKHLGHMEGEAKRERLDRPKRKQGGGVGADTSPLTTANKTSDRRGPSEADDKRGITGEA